VSFFSGPSKYVTVRMAQGVASIALQLKYLRDLPAEAQESILEGMRSEGAPTSMEELMSSAASVIAEHKMGAWRKSQFLGMIRATMISGGMSQADVAYFIGMIELAKGSPEKTSHLSSR